MKSSEAETNDWDGTDYRNDHSFVYEYGADVLALLDPHNDERILDLGCGTGELTRAISSEAADVVGVDTSPEMLETARESDPECSFVCMDARELSFETHFDAVFSNAMLHWILDADQNQVLQNVHDVLASGGRFVGEMGGNGNVAAITNAVERELTQRGYEFDHPWYFPSIGEYATRLESTGFEVRDAQLFDRPTELENGEDGLEAWLELFGDGLFAPLSSDEQDAVIAAVEDDLRDQYFRDGTWIADYRRLRFVAVAQ
ncbi:class I SAM-dependent methyltransferase [Natronolimnobius baerhuensis]|uniref:SAM-dependent methyltransferase n=1 Tax=Natronolimnobius baerhuensis TaxID=253108 RepID=A0A202EAV4_9EURY|nr:class I SAM-dependent methyltransferase [Natronolimnobius baerhuensis]OVE85403.1 SAM-dependent methyltransferase [Natronolimnobius baerhuensis]